MYKKAVIYNEKTYAEKSSVKSHFVINDLESFSSRESSMYGISPHTKNSTKCYTELKIKPKTSFHSDFQIDKESFA